MQQTSSSRRLVAVTFSREALISSLSPGTEQWSGYSARELIGQPVTHLLADRSVFELPQLVESAEEWGTWEGDVVFMNRSGGQLCTRGSISPLAGAGFYNPGFLLVSALIRKSAPSSEDRTILRDVGARLRDLSHEMNNPLAVMMGFIQLIMLNPQCAGKVRADMEKLFSEMDRVVHVVERLHQYALSMQEDRRDGVVDSAVG